MIVALAAILTATLTAGGCQPQEPGPPDEPDADVSYAELPPAPTGSEDPRNRENVVPVPKGTSPRAVEFTDADTGYALFSSCVNGQACQVGLVLTLDGGSSWISRKLPFDDASEVDMHLGWGDVLIVKAVPAGYFISHDTGRTFERRPLDPPPAELNLAEPRFSVDQDQQLMELTGDGKRVALPGRPVGNHIFFTSLVGQADGKLWVSAQAVDATPGVATVTVWSSTDHGRTWHPEGAARLPDSTVEPHLVVAPDGSDVWLAGDRFAARHAAGGTWTEATAMREVSDLRGAEVLPGGVLLVASGQGVWLVDPQQRVRDEGARTIFRLRRLTDTTILGYPAQQSGEVWLCAVQDKRCEWSRVAVSAR